MVDEQPQSNIFAAQRRTVDLIFERAGTEVKVFRTVDDGTTDAYGKTGEGQFLVADDVLAIIDATGTKPGGSGVGRREDRYGERVEWEPVVYFKSSAPVLEKDIIEYAMPRYPKNPNSDKQLWELETIVPFETHIEGSLQRFIEQ